MTSERLCVVGPETLTEVPLSYEMVAPYGENVVETLGTLFLSVQVKVTVLRTRLVCVTVVVVETVVEVVVVPRIHLIPFPVYVPVAPTPYKLVLAASHLRFELGKCLLLQLGAPEVT